METCLQVYFDFLFDLETLDHGFLNLGFHSQDYDVTNETIDSSYINPSSYNPYFQMTSSQIWRDYHTCSYDYSP